MNYFVTAIHTDSGKTLVSAILCEALHADYWKPVQAGSPTDSETVARLISNATTKIHPEAYLLKKPASPHDASKAEGIEIKRENFILPSINSDLIIEGAGGCLVPLAKDFFVVDLITLFHAEVILVSNLYLGSINHTLLTAEALKNRNIRIKGIIFNGEPNPESESIILATTKLPLLLHIIPEKLITKEVVLLYAQQLKKNLHV
ncbi:MAG TPA: dethiobiotin synthase [Chryseolinea sp.]|nr:dethiobiotin synthase [Chryseolinea sp.]HPH46191.1 dethiobiotin synthase [Chryseolinea sp.]HPM30047.1 dethiobiotin synthase [Chryseolinea sp.]